MIVGQANIQFKFDLNKVHHIVGRAVELGIKNVADHVKDVAIGNVTSTSFRGDKLRSGIVSQMTSNHSAEVRATWIGSRLTERGGTVRPVKMQWLAIPVNPAAKNIGQYGYGPRAIGDLFFVKSKLPGTALLAKKSSSKGRLDVWYILKKATNHTARPYLSPALKSSIPNMVQWFKEGAAREVPQ